MTPRNHVALAVLLACLAGPIAAQQSSLLIGTITYRERIALPQTAVIEVRLEDVSRADAVPPVVARMRIEKPGQVPVRFNLDVDHSSINPRGRYALRATIKDRDVVLFTSMDTALVLTQGHGNRAELTLTRVGSPKPAPQVEAPPPPAPALPPHPFAELPVTFVGPQSHLNLFRDDSFVLRGTGKSGAAADDLGSWALSSDRRVLILKGRGEDVRLYSIQSGTALRRLEADGRTLAAGTDQDLAKAAFQPVEIRATMRGSYDAISFLECSTGQRWPVVAGPGSRDLQNAYTKARPVAGAAVLIDIEGRVTPRPRSESGTQPTVVVERFGRALPKESCAPRFASAPLTDTFWRLTYLGAGPVAAATDPRRQPSLTFSAGSNGFTGSSGCNRLIGTYTASNATMTFKSGGRMTACKDEAKAEAAFLSALQATRTYRIMGRILELIDAKGTPVARFEARVPSGITVR